MLLRLAGLIVLCVIGNNNAQWPSMEVAQTRFTGICGEAGQFDCGVLGENRCIPIKNFHDGKPNCPDESDEFCFPGQIRCGSYCANLEHLADCITTPRCADELGIKSSPDTQEASFCSLLKRKLCLLPNAVPCKGYGECVLRKWLMDGKQDCFDGSDEEASYANFFKFIEQAGHHIQPHIISTGGGSALIYPFGAPPPQLPSPSDTQHAASPVPITVPPLHSPTTFASNTLYPHQLSSLHTIHPTQHPYQSISDHSIGTLYPHQPTPDHSIGTLYPHQQTHQPTNVQTLYPNQPTTLHSHQQTHPTTHATLYPNQFGSVHTVTSTLPSTTKPTPTWWPFGRETFETTKEYVEKLDEFGEVYGPSTHSWHSADLLTEAPPVESHTQAPHYGVNEQTIGPTQAEWEVYPKEGEQAVATSVEPTGFTVDLPASPGGDLQQPWWLQPRPAIPTQTSTLYPNQGATTVDIKPFVVPGGDIFVWPNGSVNGPWLKKSTTTTQHTRPSFVPFKTTLKPVETPNPMETSTVWHSTIVHTHAHTFTHPPSPTTTLKTHLSTPTRPPSTHPTTMSALTQGPQPTSGVWLIDPGQQIPPPPIPDLGYPQSATPVLIPPTYMPIVSTYPPQETFAPGPSTLLPIYPEIGQNVKNTQNVKQKPGEEVHRTTREPEPITQPAVQSTIGEGEGFTERPGEWVTSDHGISTTIKPEVVVPHKTSTLPSTTPTEPTSKTTKTHHLPLQTTTEQYQIETTTAKSEEFTTDQRQTTEHEIIETTVESINTSQPLIPTSTQSIEESTEPSSQSPIQWAPAVAVGGLSSLLAEAGRKKLKCTQKFRDVAEKLIPDPKCQCGVGEMPSNRSGCERASLMTFRVKLKKLCGKRLSKEDEKLAASMAVMKVANSGTESVCLRDVDADKSSFILNAMCSEARNCSIEDLQHSVSSSFAASRKHRDDLSDIELEIEELKDGACTYELLNDCISGTVCEPLGLQYRCRCPNSDVDSKGNGQDCFAANAQCIRIFGICLIIWLLILLLSLCILPLLCCFTCYRCGYLQHTAIWPKLQELGFFRSKRQDLESNAPRVGSPTQKHNEGLPRPPDASVFPIAKLPEIPSHVVSQKDHDASSVPDYYNVNNESDLETDSASHGLVSLVSTDQSRIATSEDGRDQTGKSAVAAEIHREPSAGQRVGETEADTSKADAEEKKSNTSRAGTPTIWEKFQILGNQYSTQVTEKPPSETNSLDSLIRRYQDKELARLKEKEPELFRITESPSTSLSKQLPTVTSGLQHIAADTKYSTSGLPQTNLPYFTHIPPTPLQSQDKFFDSAQQNQRFFQQQLPSATEDESSSATPLPIEDAIALAEQLNQEYKQRRETRRLNGEPESSIGSSDNSSLASTLPPTPNSDELFHYPKIDNTFDYEEQDPELSETETPKQAFSSKNVRRAATSDQARSGARKVQTGRVNTVRSADGTWKQNELALAEALASGPRPLPMHLRLKMPIDSPEAIAERREARTKASTMSKKSTPESRQSRRSQQHQVERGKMQKREPKPQIPAAARRQPSKVGQQSDSQKPPRAPMKNVPLASGPQAKKTRSRPEGPTFGQSRSSTMSSGQKRQPASNEQQTRASASLPNSERRLNLKRGSLPMGDLQPPKRSPSLPSIGENAVRPKLNLKAADFMIADIDLDLPGPHMIPATLDDIKSGRLAEVIAGTSKELEKEIRTRETTVVAKGKSIIKKQGLTLEKHELDPDLEDSSRLPPIKASRQKGGLNTMETPETDLIDADLPFQDPLISVGQRMFLDSRSLATASELDQRVHANCLTDRPPWDNTPLKEGDMEKIPLDYNLPRPHSLSSFSTSQRRSRSYNLLKVHDLKTGAASERLNMRTRLSHSQNPLLLEEDPIVEEVNVEQKRESKGWKQIGKMPTNLEERRSWVEELKHSLNSEHWLEYD